MTTGLGEMTDIDRLIHEPARLVIMAILYTVESADFLYLKREAGLTKGNLSSHLSKLEAANYVSIEKTYDGKIPLTVCQLTALGRRSFETYRAQVKQFVDRTK